MRLAPVAHRYNTGIKNSSKSQTQFERNNSSVSNSSSCNSNLNGCPHCAHQYTGEACADLAYASMFDNAIAKDLKLMGLI